MKRRFIILRTVLLFVFYFLIFTLSGQVRLKDIQRSPQKYRIMVAQDSVAGRIGYVGKWVPLAELLDSINISVIGPQGPAGIQGADGISYIWRGAWSVSTQYYGYDVVRDSGRAYICIAGHIATSGKKPYGGIDSGDYWDLMVDRGANDGCSDLDSVHTVIGLQDSLNLRQRTLVSGTNIKTINGAPLLGSGNISISGGIDSVHTVVGLQDALDGKSDTEHNHSISSVVALQDSLNVRARTAHIHSISNVAALQDSLNVRARTAHIHTISNVTALQDSLNVRQRTLVSGTNIATVNGKNLLTASNIDVFPPSLKTGPMIAVYNGKNVFGGITQRFGIAYSFDGKTFLKNNTAILTPGPSAFDVNHLAQASLIDVGGVLYLYYSAYSGSEYSIGLATSKDYGATWTKVGQVLAKTGAGWESSQVYFPEVIYDVNATAGKQFKMWYLGFQGSVGKIGYAYSADGITWTRYPSNPVKDLGTSGTFDDSHVVPGEVLFFDGKYHLFYHAYDDATYNVGYVSFTNPESNYGTGTLILPKTRENAKQSLTGNFTSGASSVTVANSSVFQVNETIVIYDNDSEPEFAVISAIPNGTTLTLDRVINVNFTTAQSAKINSIYWNKLAPASVLYDDQSRKWVMYLTVFGPCEPNPTGNYQREFTVTATSDNIGGPYVLEINRGVVLKPMDKTQFGVTSLENIEILTNVFPNNLANNKDFSVALNATDIAWTSIKTPPWVVGSEYNSTLFTHARLTCDAYTANPSLNMSKNGGAAESYAFVGNNSLLDITDLYIVTGDRIKFTPTSANASTGCSVTFIGTKQ